MASADVPLEGRRDWVLANPWPWMMGGLAAAGLAWLCAAVFGDPAPAARFSLLLLGLLGAGVAVVLRLRSARPAFLQAADPGVRRLTLGLLLLVYGLLVLSLTALLAIAWFRGQVFVWRPGNLVLIWLVTVPMSAVAALRTYRRLATGAPVEPGEEASALLTLAALAVFACCRALNVGVPDTGLGESWDTLQLFLAVLAFVALVAAPLPALSQRGRRAVLSLLVLLHFGGICTAAMAAPPSPWLMGQLWTRIYRPYLEFMYLNNAYHFYSPEPGPASYLWFRLQYEDGKGNLHGHWVKVPDVGEDGRHRYPVALAYQRRLSITEKTVPAEAASFWVLNENGEWVFAPFFLNRLRSAPEYSDEKEQAEVRLGVQGPNPLPKDRLRVPWHPTVPQPQQYIRPAFNQRILLASYARFACRTPHPEHPEWPVRSAQVYRVIHDIPPLNQFAHWGMDPRDPEYYRPYYMGAFDPEGNLLTSAQEDPFLYWLLPNVREVRANPNSPVQSFARKHAGDENWVYYPELGMWKNPAEVRP